MAAEFHVDGRTDRQTHRWSGVLKLIVAFRNFVNTPKQHLQLHPYYANSWAMLRIPDNIKSNFVEHPWIDRKK